MEQVVSGKQSYFSSTRIAVIAMFSAIAGVLYCVNIAITAAFPSWLELNFSDIPVLIGTFTLGPVSGVAIVVVKILLKLVIKGTSTMFVGELADLLIGCALVLPAGFIYKKNRTFKGAIAAMAIGSVCSVAVSILFNWLIFVPYYVFIVFGGSWDVLVRGMNVLFPACTKETFYNYYLWISVLPFNLMRCLIAVLVTLPIYKRISNLINKLNAKLTPKEDEDGSKTKKINLRAIIIGAAVVALLVVIALVRFFFFK